MPAERAGVSVPQLDFLVIISKAGDSEPKPICHHTLDLDLLP